MAFPRLNNISFCAAGCRPSRRRRAPAFVGPAPARAGLYPPLNSAVGHPGPSVGHGDLRPAPCRRDLVLGAINFITTIFNMRAPGMTAAQDAAVRLGVLVTAFPAAAGGAGRRAAPSPCCFDPTCNFRHDLLRSGRRRRSGAVPAPVLVLRPPRSLHHDPAGLRHHQPRHLHLRQEADLRLSRHGLRHGRDRRRRLVVWAHHMFTVGSTSIPAPISRPRQ